MDGSIDTSTTKRQQPLNYLHDTAALNSDDFVVAWVVMSKLTDDACCKRRAYERSTRLSSKQPSSINIPSAIKPYYPDSALWAGEAGPPLHICIWIWIWITWMPRPDKVVHTGQIPYFPSYIIGDGAGGYHCVRICYSIVASCNFYRTRGLLILQDPILSAWPALCVQAILFQSFKYLIFKIIFLDAFLFL